jgi:hypothetical protein
VKTIFDLCEPRKDVAKGDIAKSDFAADLAQVIKGTASHEYLKADLFFRNTYPTRGLKSLLANVCARLSGAAGEVAAIFRLGTSFGGGKTHSLIALVHAANGMRGVRNAAEFIDPAVVPKGRVRVAAFDGENADPANGRNMGDGYLLLPRGARLLLLLLAGRDTSAFAVGTNRRSRPALRRFRNYSAVSRH